MAIVLLRNSKYRARVYKENGLWLVKRSWHPLIRYYPSQQSAFKNAYFNVAFMRNAYNA